MTAWYLIVMSSYVSITVTPMPSERACRKIAATVVEMLSDDRRYLPVAKCVKVKA